MGLPEFKEEFDAFKATLPDPSMVAWHSEGERLPHADYALDRTETMFYLWWASMVSASDDFRLLIQKQEGEALRFGLEVGVSHLVKQTDWVIDFFERLPPLPDWNTPDLTLAQRAELMNFAMRYLPSIQRWLLQTRSLRESVQSITRDYGSHD